LTYDAAGNITGQTGTNAYTTTINLEGRIATLVKGTVTTTYAYNGMGQRVRKFSSSGATSTTIFVYDQQGNLLGEYGNTGTPIREYVWMNGELVAIFTPNGTNPPNIFYVHNDHLGSPKLVYTKANVLRWRWMTEPFGTTAPENTPTAGQAAFTQPIRFPGQYHDTESNLFYNHHRTYDQTSGRYTQSDPIGLDGGINTYSYVSGNPISLVDPDGLCPCGDVIDLLQLARGDKRDWSKAADRSDVNKAFKKGTNKCNLFVDDQYENAGYNLPNTGGMPWNKGKYPPGAGQLSNPSFNLPGWPRVSGPAQPGDLVAHGGHVGIATSPTTTISATTDLGILENNWGSRAGQQGVVIRRCSCGR
jgi:RHS repeat-associated protein